MKLPEEKKNIITDEETATDLFIDNKRVYIKRINFGALPNTTSKQVAHGLDFYNECNFIKIENSVEGYFSEEALTNYKLTFGNIMLVPGSTTLFITCVLGYQYITIRTLSDCSNANCYTTIYYTKEV